MKKSAVPLGVGLVLSMVALAELPESTGIPSLQFRTIPLEGARSTEHRVTPYRLFDKLVVTVWDPVVCGQKAVNPAFSIQGDKLFLSYSLSPVEAGVQNCTLVSEFDLSNVPHRDIEVNFAGGPEPYVVAKLRKCPNYTPRSDDIYECLAPAIK
ncbi:MAG: hypothetical protein NFW16_09575 [Candidatus Accumulibacter sp.]|uniref:hypothetical protein n=1 Tax=Accumulibacter sp. TaxID=2053492 RepID=UPI00258DE6E5|nr:hypothetical protein [Accumulibacter sp.]MCM8621968.1 hypothetical protein [Accumulibacter sp.]